MSMAFAILPGGRRGVSKRAIRALRSTTTESAAGASPFQAHSVHGATADASTTVRLQQDAAWPKPMQAIAGGGAVAYHIASPAEIARRAISIPEVQYS